MREWGGASDCSNFSSSSFDFLFLFPELCVDASADGDQEDGWQETKQASVPPIVFFPPAFFDQIKPPVTSPLASMWLPCESANAIHGPLPLHGSFMYICQQQD